MEDKRIPLKRFESGNEINWIEDYSIKEPEKRFIHMICILLLMFIRQLYGVGSYNDEYSLVNAGCAHDDTASIEETIIKLQSILIYFEPIRIIFLNQVRYKWPVRIP